MSDLPARAIPAPLPTATEAARYAAESLSAATRRAYRADWADFAAWCRQHGHPALPAAPEAIAAYLAALAAIGGAHALAGHPWNPGHPAIRHTLRGILRRHGTPARQAAALTTAEIRRLLAGCDRSLTGTRDRALWLLGFAGALRRSELVAIEREHVSFTAEGLRLLLPRSKGDAAGEGATIGIARGRRPETCPVRAHEAWLQMSDCRYGPVFRKVDRWGTIESRALTPEAVGHILKRRAEAAGLSIGALERLSAHGLRAGFVTEAYQAAARDEQIRPLPPP
jgi:integrase